MFGTYGIGRQVKNVWSAMAKATLLYLLVCAGKYRECLIKVNEAQVCRRVLIMTEEGGKSWGQLPDRIVMTGSG